MKEIQATHILVLACLVLPASALAQSEGTVSLAWEQCAGSSSAARDASPPCAGDVSARRLVATFRPSRTIPDFIGVGVVLHVSAQGGGGWWAFDGDGCRAGALELSDSKNVGCASPFGDATLTQSVAVERVTRSPGQWIVQVQITRDRPRALAPSDEGYVAAALDLLGAARKAVQSCGGCEQPACIRVQSIAAIGQFSGTHSMMPRDTSSYVTWRGGAAGCAGAVPTRNRTWGEVKALFR